MIVRQYSRLPSDRGGFVGASTVVVVDQQQQQHQHRIDWLLLLITNTAIAACIYFMIIVMLGSNVTTKCMVFQVPSTYTTIWYQSLIQHQQHRLQLTTQAPYYNNRSSFAVVSAATFHFTGVKRRNHRYQSLHRIQQQRRLASDRFSSSSSSSSSSASYSSSSSDSIVSSWKSRFITYLTDVEGDRDYLQRYVEQSKILCWKEIRENELQQHRMMMDRPFSFPYTHYIDFQRNDNDNNTSVTNGQQQERQLPQTDDILVYGGDIWDQGGSDLYVIRQLLDLKLRYPKNVYFVMGNRDINKMRIVEEIGHARTTDDNLPTHNGCYWFENSGRIGDPKLGLLPYNTAVDRLKWMLNYTMGSPRAFEYRRWELQDLCYNSTIITDEDVVESYRQSCDPITGEMSHYLRNASLCLRIGDVAFIHGAFPFTSENLKSFINNSNNSTTTLWDDSSFAMPWLEPGVTASDVDVHNPNDWIRALNSFAKSSVESWVDCNGQSDEIWSLRGGYHPTSSYGQLLQYGMGRTGGTKRGLNPTVVYNRWGIPGTPRKFFRCDPTCELDKAYVHNTKDFFRRTGIRLICSGHQPAGEMPCHIRVDDHDHNSTSWIVSGDTSYTGDTVWLNLPGDNNAPIQNLGRGHIKSGRGPHAVSEVVIEQCTKTGAVVDVYSHGTFSDGSQYRSQNLDFGPSVLPNHPNDDDVLRVGTLASGPFVPSARDSPHGGQWWTQAALDDGSILLAAGSGFNYWTRKVQNR